MFSESPTTSSPLTTPPTVPSLELIDGTAIPQLGFGVYKVDDAGAETAVGTAIEAGYRLIDTAKLYDNEAGVGRAIARADVPRDDLYITTKVWNDDQGFDTTLRAFDASMERLGLDFLDLYLIHWPFPGTDLYVDTYRALIRLKDDGRLRSVGVSNFQPDHLERIVAETGVTPVVNQVELNPYFQQTELRLHHAAKGIATEAWAPIGAGRGLLDDPALLDIAAKHGATPAQVVLRWHLHLGNIVIPKSVTPARIVENIDVFGFELDSADMSSIEALDRGDRNGPDPDVFGA